MRKKIHAYELGKTGELIALRYLEKKNYRLLEKGFRFLRGEIDLIAKDGPALVFIEVKTREKSHFVQPEESVTPAKRKQIRRLAQGYLLKNRIEDVECRFDVITITRDIEGRCLIQHIENAF